MRKIFVTSDTHYNHAKMLTFESSSRGKMFKDVFEMNRTMINNWNNVVQNEDIVYHLGDVYFGNKLDAADLLRHLKGRKRLILGNHDDGKDPVLHHFFEKILVSRIFKGSNAILTHIPIDARGLREDKYARNIHGHIHDQEYEKPQFINICVEKTNYTPVDISSL